MSVRFLKTIAVLYALCCALHKRDVCVDPDECEVTNAAVLPVKPHFSFCRRSSRRHTIDRYEYADLEISENSQISHGSCNRRSVNRVLKMDLKVQKPLVLSNEQFARKDQVRVSLTERAILANEKLLRDEIQNLREVARAESDLNARLEIELISSKKNVRRLEAEVKVLQEGRQDISLFEEELKKLTNQNSKRVQDLEHALVAHQSTIESLRRDLAAKKEKVFLFEAEVSSLQDLQVQLNAQKDLVVLSEKRAAANERLLKDEIRCLKAETVQIKCSVDLESAHTLLHEANTKVSELGHELEAQVDKNANVIKVFQQELAAKESTIMSLKSKLAKFEEGAIFHGANRDPILARAGQSEKFSEDEIWKFDAIVGKNLGGRVGIFSSLLFVAAAILTFSSLLGSKGLF